MNNPVIHNDPTGHCIEDLCIGEIAIAAVVVSVVLEADPELPEQVMEGVDSVLPGAEPELDQAAGAAVKVITDAATPIINKIGVDTNVLINAIDNGQADEIDNALAGRTPVVSPQAADEFLRQGNPEALNDFLKQRGDEIGSLPTADEIAELQNRAQNFGRVLHDGDASVVASALRDGLSLLTNDQRVLRFLNQLGKPGEGY